MDKCGGVLATLGGVSVLFWDFMGRIYYFGGDFGGGGIFYFAVFDIIFEVTSVYFM